MTDVALNQLTRWLERFGVSGLHGRSVDELFTSAAMSAVGESGPVYGTFFLRFGMTAGAVASLSPAALGDALAGGLEGVQARGDSETATDIGLAIAAYRSAVEGGADSAAAASTALAAAGSEAALFAALAAALS